MGLVFLAKFRLKTKAKVAKSDKKKQPAKKPKAKGLAVLSEVALTEAEQLKLATKRSKTQFHSSHVSGSGTGTIQGFPDVPIYDSESDKESWGDGDEEDDDEDDFEDDADNNDDDSNDNDESDDERTKSDRDEIPDPNKTNEEHDEQEEEHDDEFNIEEDEKMDEEEYDEVTKELYKDVNVNLGNKDADITDVDQKTGGPTQSSSVSSDFTRKLLNLDNPSPADNEIPFLMDTIAYHATAILEITSKTITSLIALLDFASVFKFNERVTNLEKIMSEIKKVDHYAQVLSSIPAIVDHYMDKKLGEAINKAIQAHNFDYREEAQVEKKEYIELVDSTSSYEIAATLSEFELTKILIDNMEKNKSFDIANYKRELYDALVKYYNTDKDIFESYGKVFSLKRSGDDKDKDQDPSAGSDRGTKRKKSSKEDKLSRDSSHTVEDSGMQQDQEFITRDNDEQPADIETWISQVARAEEPPTSFDFFTFVLNRLKIPKSDSRNSGWTSIQPAQ
nr:hypothetical protein [Tanacetum cinerariifolium]